MIFSALIDADRTCTERFCLPELAAERQVERPSIEALECALRTHLDGMTIAADATEVNRQRAFVLQKCKLASTGDPPCRQADRAATCRPHRAGRAHACHCEHTRLCRGPVYRSS